MARKSQKMTDYINNNADKLLHAFNQHVGCFSIAELFKRMLQPYPMGNVTDTVLPADRNLTEYFVGRIDGRCNGVCWNVNGGTSRSVGRNRRR